MALKQGFKPQDVAFVVGDAMAPALPDSSFDLVISVEAAAYMTNKRWG
jgi:ubiquinone/menaquinone biosynthesis C-methylase UbiE